jgi:hypothetical protein
MGRLSDAMSAIFLGYATLHHFSRNMHVEGLSALAESSMLQACRDRGLLSISASFT